MPLPKAVNPDHSIAFIILAIVFMLFISGSFFIGNLPFSIFVLYWGGSIISFIVYRIDKSAAESGQWRIREGTLGFLALIGGWPGALVAQRLFHHKTNKKSFQFSFWIIVILNCCLLCLSLTASGSAVIH
jgi:uncharacterized membrane protein YsdA (DUF1294 family)